MGILNLNKQIEEAKRKDLKKRAPQFLEEYRALREKWGCDWNATLVPIPGNKGLVVEMAIIDVKDEVAEEIEQGKKAEERK